MKKRLYKKLHTDIMYQGKSDDLLFMESGNTRYRKVFDQKVKQGLIKVVRGELPAPYREVERWMNSPKRSN